MKQIAIFTAFRGLYNYGQILQAYALTHYLNLIGHNARLIEYKFDVDSMCVESERKDSLINTIKFWLKKSFIYDPLYLRLKDRKKFLEFKKCHLKIDKKKFNTIYELRKDPPIYDVYMTGSDQIWGRHISRIEPFFLDFGSADVKRIAYAPSFGRSHLSQDEIIRLTPLLGRYTAVGVREESALQIMETLNYPSACWVPDPTILLTKEEWGAIQSSNSPFITNKTRIFVYIIGHDRDERIMNYAKSFGDAELIVCADNLTNEYQNSNLTIPEWISAMSHCDLVITNSFHGTMFSLIFNKEFYIFERIGKNSQMNVRIESILSIVELKNRIVHEADSIESIIRSDVDWGKANTLFALWRNVGIDFLKQHLQ